ncbi:MAG: hypothetical protein AAB472_01805 [Patescibacteria group bacterium]
MERPTLIILITSLVVIGGGVATYLVFSHKAVAPAPTQGTLNSQDLQGQALFTDGEYGFSLRYPEKYETSFNFASYYHLPSYWRANALPEATGTPILAIVGYRLQSEHSYPRYYDAEVRVSASKDPKEVARCEKAASEQGEKQLPDAVIGGTTFKVFSFQDAAAMQYVKGVSYRTVHEGACVVLEQLATGSNYRDDPKSSEDISDDVLTSKYDALNAIIPTFAFAHP